MAQDYGDMVDRSRSREHGGVGLGLAVDIVALSYQQLDEKQTETAEQQWLMHNSYKFGFILRYHLDKSHITGIEYEPWHYRYVGVEAAKEIYEKRISFEEYLKNN